MIDAEKRDKSKEEAYNSGNKINKKRFRADQKQSVNFEVCCIIK
jgi:hypothetical protein